jgi:hypothetical protein
VTDSNAIWHSIDEVNQFASATGFVPGDQILFQSGQTFAGSLFLQSTDQQLNMGRPDAPITIGSYDPSDPTNPLPARATIASGAGGGIEVYNAAGYHITDLNLQGGWNHNLRTGNSSDGIIFDGNLGTGVVLSFVHIDHVAISGYGVDSFNFDKGNGILFGNVENSACAYNYVSITDSVIHEGVSNGIYSRAGKISNLLLDHIQIYDIYGLTNVNSGYGIHMWNLGGAVVERCEVFNTGLWGGDPNAGGPDGSGGPVAVDVSHSSHVLFQYNDAHNNHDHAGRDGDGFDFDEQTVDSIMQYNYSHDNDGVGYMLGTWSMNGYNSRNVLRYNVSENDCRYWNYGAILVETQLVTDCEIYNNTVYLSANDGHNSSTLAAIEVPLSGQTVHVRNNVFQTAGGVPAAALQSNLGSGLLFQGNYYDARSWTPSGTQPLILWGNTRFTNLDDWRTGTHNSQEYLNGMPLGTQGNPLLINPGAAGGLDNPLDPHYVPNHIDQLGGLLAGYYACRSPSRGVDLTQLGLPQWDPFNLQSQGGYPSAYWVATQDFAGHAFAWGGDTDSHTPGAFQFPLGIQPALLTMGAGTSAVSGTAFSITVRAVDPNGTVDPFYRGVIHFTVTDTDGGVVLPGDYTFTTADGGQHTFDGVKLITQGYQTITAIDVAAKIAAAATISVLGGNGSPGGSSKQALRPLANPNFGPALTGTANVLLNLTARCDSQDQLYEAGRDLNAGDLHPAQLLGDGAPAEPVRSKNAGARSRRSQTELAWSYLSVNYTDTGSVARLATSTEVF